MDRTEIEQVLKNWIQQATTDSGHLSEGVDPAHWVACQFLNWWQPRIEDALSDAELAVNRAMDEMKRLGGWENPQLGEALDELAHASESLVDVRGALGLIDGG